MSSRPLSFLRVDAPSDDQHSIEAWHSAVTAGEVVVTLAELADLGALHGSLLSFATSVSPVVPGVGAFVLIADANAYVSRLHYLVGFAYGATYEVMEMGTDPTPDANWPAGDGSEFGLGVAAGRAAIRSDNRLLSMARIHVYATGDPARLLNEFWHRATAQIDGANGQALRWTILTWPTVGHT